MILPLRLFNSVMFMFVSLTIALYTCKRFFQAMRAHYKLVTEVTEFNSIVMYPRDKLRATVHQARSSLDYIGSKVSDAMKEIEGDIGKELHVTHQLTKLNSKMSLMLKRFANLEEGVIELVRMDYNMENAKVETPPNINEEVKKALTLRKKSVSKFSKFPQQSPPGANYEFEFPGSRPVSGKSATSIRKNSETVQAPKDKQEHNSSKPRTVVFPVVQLLSEQKRHFEEKPIGFRPN